MIKLPHKIYQNSLLSILIISGALKVILDYYDYPYNLTFQILSLITMDIFYCCLINSKRIRVNRNELIFISLILIFYGGALLSLFYTSSESFAYKKLILMAIPLISLVYVKLIIELDLKILFNFLQYIILPVAVWFILFKFLLWNNSDLLNILIDKEKFAPLRHEYLNFGILIGLYGLLSIEFSKKAIISILLSFTLVLGVASRGAFVFLIFTLIVLYFNNIISFFAQLKIKKKVLKSVTFVLLVLTILGVFFIDKINKILYFGLARFASLANIQSDSSALGRIEQYIFVFNEGLSLNGLLFGHGIGSFGIDYVGVDESAYPHNIFLEAWYELGFVSMSILLLFFLLPFNLNRPLLYKSLAFFALLNALKSHSFAYDRNLFIFFGILIFHSFNKKLQSTDEIKL